MSVEGTDLVSVAAMRESYRREMDCQIVHDSWHARGFTDLFLLRADGGIVGYGAVGGAPGEPRTTVKELYVAPRGRGDALALFGQLVEASGAATIEAQTNDPLLLLMLFDRATQIESQTLLFEDVTPTSRNVPGVRVRQLTDADRAGVFAHSVEPVGDWGLDDGGTIVATGGWATHYNPPYADLYMEVAPSHRHRGLGTFLVQELKRLSREAGLVPAARCHVGNVGSRRTLERAGMFPCARIVRGRLVP